METMLLSCCILSSGVRGGLRRAPSARTLSSQRPTRATHDAANNVGRGSSDRVGVLLQTDIPYLFCVHTAQGQVQVSERASTFPPSPAPCDRLQPRAAAIPTPARRKLCAHVLCAYSSMRSLSTEAETAIDAIAPSRSPDCQLLELLAVPCPPPKPPSCARPPSVCAASCRVCDQGS